MKKILLLQFVTIFLYAGNIAVSILPQKYIVSKIVGSDKNITVLIPPNASPASYKPTPKELEEIKNASIYFTIGVPFEKHWLDRFKSTNSNLEVVDTTEGIKKFSNDPHLWLDPKLDIIMAKNIAQRVAKDDPKNRKKYEDNFQRFKSQMQNLDKKIKDRLKDLKQRIFITYHPSFGYFARAYDLKQISIEKDGHKPSIKHALKVVDLAKKYGIKRIFVSPAFSQKEAKFIAIKIDGKAVSIDHLSEDINKTLWNIASSFE